MATEEEVKEFHAFGAALARFVAGHMREHPVLAPVGAAAKMVQQAALIVATRGVTKEAFLSGAELAWRAALEAVETERQRC